jgi:hypothetical protein
MSPSQVYEEQDTFFRELLEFSSQAATKKAKKRRPATSNRGAEWSSLSRRHAHNNHAAPLMPLKDRDLEVLADFFEDERIHEIEADVIRNLLIRWPEPCWEEEPLQFLQDYL